jgi:ApaG protein
MLKAEFEVSVRAEFLPAESSAQDGLYRFAYVVTIKNIGEMAGQLIGRHWVIEDAKGGHQEVRGLGVVGQQPFLQPGESFTYDSSTQITSPVGSMHGTYFCVAEDASFFETPIPPFSLRAQTSGPGKSPSSVLH